VVCVRLQCMVQPSVLGLQIPSLHFIVGGTGRCVDDLETGLWGGIWLVLKCNVKSIVETDSPFT